MGPKYESFVILANPRRRPPKGGPNEDGAEVTSGREMARKRRRAGPKSRRRGPRVSRVDTLMSPSPRAADGCHNVVAEGEANDEVEDTRGGG